MVNSPPMRVSEAVAAAHPNIALVKYWGDRDHALRIPSNGSISLTLGGLKTQMRVGFDPGLERDQLLINQVPAEPAALQRVSVQLDLIRQEAAVRAGAIIHSETDFPMAAGLASSAAAFAALTLAGCSAAGLELGRTELSALARRGSGSAARSIFGGFVELVTGEDAAASVARPIAEPGHWPIVDLIVVTDPNPKPTGSTAGHSSAQTSPFQAARVSDAPRRLQACREAVLAKDFQRLAEIVEQDSDMLHAVMMTSRPALHYWQPSSLAIMSKVRSLRSQGVAACYTVDAGPNVHCLCLPEAEPKLREGLAQISPDFWILRAEPGPGAWLV
ncbi:MAG: diphosphomevalonate decarboxylase [Anaerolineales bacterium]